MAEGQQLFLSVNIRRSRNIFVNISLVLWLFVRLGKQLWHFSLLNNYKSNFVMIKYCSLDSKDSLPYPLECSSANSLYNSNRFVLFRVPATQIEACFENNTGS